MARLHEQELPGGDLVVLGREFLERIYYGRLLEDPSYFCYICLVEGEVAGFTTFSTDYQRAFRRTLLRAWPLIGWIVLKRLARRPAIIVALLKQSWFLLTMRREEYAEIRTEILTTAVDRRYRTLDFFRRTGLNITRDLYVNTARVLLSRGVRVLKGFTRKSNVWVSASISALGWEKVYEGWHLRGTGREETCIWTWDLGRAAARFGWTGDGPGSKLLAGRTDAGPAGPALAASSGCGGLSA